MRTFDFFIAGVKFHEANRPINRGDEKGVHRIIEELEEGMGLTLQPEPDNKFDPNAVQILYGAGTTEHMLGYVPKKFSASVCSMFELSPDPKCTVLKLDINAKPWEQIKVTITWEDGESATDREEGGNG